MDLTTPHREAEHSQELYTSKVEPPTTDDKIPLCSSPPLNYDIFSSNIPFDPFQAYTTIAPDVPSSIPFYYATEYFPEYSSTTYSPYYAYYLDNYILKQPLTPSQYSSLQFKHQPPALYTPPTTPHIIDQGNQCRITTPTHPHTHPPSPGTATQAAEMARRVVPALDPTMAELERVRIDTNNHVWNGRYGNGYGDRATAVAQFSPAQEHAPYADMSFAPNVHAMNHLTTPASQAHSHPTPSPFPIIPPSPSYSQAQTPKPPSPGTTATTTTTTVNQIMKPRVQRKIRARIRRICHKCETLFSGKSCLVCQHRICDRCGEFELGRRGPVRWIGT